MDKDWDLTTLWLESVDSTQRYLLDKIKSKEIDTPTMVVAQTQTSGKGSRGNEWLGLKGNLFFSFCFKSEDLPSDLPLSASSIYFSFLLKQLLAEKGSSLWMKWPNDFYLNKEKIGGTITQVSGDWFVCGIGLNLITAPFGFEYLDIEVQSDSLLKNYQEILKFMPPWKKILKEFQIEFTKSKNFSTHVDGEKVALSDAELAEDGALIINGQRIYSLR